MHEEGGLEGGGAPEPASEASLVRGRLFDDLWDRLGSPQAVATHPVRPPTSTHLHGPLAVVTPHF